MGGKRPKLKVIMRECLLLNAWLVASKSLPVPIPRAAPQLVRVRPAAEEAVGATPEPVQLSGQDVLLDEALWEMHVSQIMFGETTSL